MVLGLIDFLLGGKRKTKLPRTGQVATSMSTVGGNIGVSNEAAINSSGLNSTNPVNGASEQNSVSTPTSQNGGGMEFVDNSQQTNQVSGSSGQNLASGNFTPSSGGGRKISEVISKIHEELKKTNEKIGTVVTDLKTLENNVNSLGHRVDDLEEYKKTIDEKLGSIDSNMTKFLSLYELINNQYNPFVEKEEKPQQIVVNSSGSSSSSSMEGLDNVGSGNELKFSQNDFDALKSSFDEEKKANAADSKDDLDSALLQLDTLDIEQAAGDAVPLKALKNNTNSLVVILSWLEYLIKRVGVEKTRDTLRYYTETLRWITPEVFFDLDKYLKGMKDSENLTGDEILTVRDHIVSLYFISKLNEKTLDEKLTKAVLQIIKE